MIFRKPTVHICSIRKYKKNSENHLIKRNTDLKNKNEQLNNKIKELERSDKQHMTINNQEQYARREMVEVNGIPNVPNENTKEIILNLAKKMNIKLDPPSFDVIHRLSDKDFAPIIIKFSTKTDRDVFNDARSQHKNLTVQDPGHNPKSKHEKYNLYKRISYEKNKIVYKAVCEECTNSPGATDRRFHPIFIKSFDPLKMLEIPVTSKIGLSAAPTWGRLGLRVAQLPDFWTFILPHSVSKLKFSNNVLISPIHKNIANLT